MTDVQASGEASLCTPGTPKDMPNGAAPDSLEAQLLLHQRDVTLLLDAGGTVRYISPSVTAIAAYAPEDVVGRNMLEFIHPEDAELSANMFARFSEGHEDPPLQFRIRTANGYWAPCEARLGLMDHPDYPDTVIASVRQINHHVRLRSHLRASERAVGVGSWRWVLTEKAPEWSDGLYALVGNDPHGGPIDVEWAYTLWHPDDRERIGDLISSVLETPSSFDTVARLQHVDGHYLTTRLYGFVETDAKGNPSALYGVVHDITVQSRTELALRESERQYRLIVTAASDMIARYDADGRCTFMSPAGQAILGFEVDEFVGNGPLRFIHPDDRESIVQLFENASETKRPANVVYRANHKDGHHVWLEASARPVFDDNGGLVEVVIIARDISERKATEDSLRAAREKAEAANRTKSRFLANMSHELRTPLNAVIGFSDIMCEEMFGSLGSEQYKDYSKLIRESGQFLLELINDILDMSKVEAGKYELYLEEVQFNELVDTSLRLINQRARDKKLTLTVNVDAGLPAFPADERAVKQILLNLLSNAVKFTPDGGVVEMTAKQTGDFLVVSVRDNGIGIAKDVIPRLARPFEQAMGDSLLSHAGAGLGLALVKSFVQLHGGELTIDSTLGEGTTVTFTLPLAQDAKAARSA